MKIKPINASIVIPVWNRCSLTGDRLLELDRLFHIRHDFEVIIINNASTDRTREMLRWWKDNSEWRMIVKHMPKNVGFGQAHNLGAKFARSKLLVLLSNDVIIEGDFIEPLLATVSEAKPDVLCSPRVIDWNAGWNEFPPDTIIPYAEGWLIGVKSSVFSKLGGFDSRYSPCDYEDMDLSYAAVSKGVKLKQVTLPVKHIGAATIGYTPERRLITENHRRLFAQKWNLSWTPVRS